MIEYDKTIKHFEEGQIVKGTVIQVTLKEVIVDIGYKSEGAISVNEFKSPEEMTVGAEVDVLLESKENEEGMVVLSKEKVERARGWENILNNCEEGNIVKGRVTKKVKGGYMVDVGIDGFLPMSQAVLREFGGADNMVGKEMDFTIIKLNKMRRSIILSRKIAMQQKRDEEKRKTIDSLTKGMVLKSLVKNITDFGAFVDIGGGVIGLLHITDMSWGRVNHPSEVVTVGDEIEVAVLDFNKDDMKISLGLKQRTPDPWERVEDKYPIGNKVTGTVVGLLPYGAFVELEKGIEGLVHISDLSWTKKYSLPNELLAIGDRIEVMVLDINKAERKISLGLKQLEQDPWVGISDRFKVGDKIKGKIRNITDYGAFVELEEGIDGLVHVSDISWTKKITHPRDILKKGEALDALILSVDEDNRRISLGLKQLMPDPWDQIQDRYASGGIFKGKVVKITNFGMFIELEKDLEGLLHISEAGLNENEKLEEKFKIDDEIDVRVIRVDGVQKKIALSRKDV